MSTDPKDGVIKFKFQLKMSSKLDEKLYIEIEKWRAILFKMNLIGEYPTEQIGYGNLSRRIESQNQFIITGTQTGKYAHLTGSHYTKVTKCDLNKMSVEAIGPIAPSSESLTHFAIYQNCPHIHYVFHVHHPQLWSFMLDNGFESTPSETRYGTQDMAKAAQTIIGSHKFGIFAMAGHEDGVIAYGSSAQEAGRAILDTMKLSKNT